MTQGITIGQYYSTESVLHRLDPRVKLRFTIIYVLVALLDRNIYQMLFLTMVCIVAYIISGVHIRYAVQGMLRINILLAVCSAVNIFTTYGSTMAAIGPFHITAEGMVKACFVFWRLLLIIGIIGLLMYTTTPVRLTDGLEKCFHINGDTAMYITLAMRFVAVYSAERTRIMRAGAARGAGGRTGLKVRIQQKIKGCRLILNSTLMRMSALREAVDAKCYTGGRGRTKLTPLVYGYIDIVAYLIMLVFTFITMWLVVIF